MSVLPHFEQIDPHQFPVAVAARKNIKRGAGLFLAQFLSFQANVRGKQIRIPLFGPQDLGAPDFRLRSHYATDKSHQFSRNDAGLQFYFLAAGNRLVQLSDETANCWIHL